MLIFKFALIQAIVATILWIIFALRILHPVFLDIKGYATEVITNANFTTLSVDHGSLGIDIKPGIFTHTVQSDDDSRITVILSQEEKMNPFYWDDRVTDGRLVKVKGVAFMRDEMMIKWKDKLNKYSYNEIPFNPTFETSKSDLYDWFSSVLSEESFGRVMIYSSIVAFLLGYVLGIFTHVIFASLVGVIVSAIKLRIDKYFVPSTKRASLVFIGYTYIFALIMVFRIFVPLGNGFFGRYPIFEIIAFCYVVYLVLKSYEYGVSGNKLNAKAK